MQYARAASRICGIVFSSDAAAVRNAFSAFSTRALSRVERRLLSRSRCSALGVTDLQQRDSELRLIGDEIVNADDNAAVLLDLPLLPRSGFRDPALKPSRLQASHHAANFLDLSEECFRFILELGS